MANSVPYGGSVTTYASIEPRSKGYNPGKLMRAKPHAKLGFPKKRKKKDGT